MKNDVKYMKQVTENDVDDAFRELFDLTHPERIDNRFYAMAEMVINKSQEIGLIRKKVNEMDVQSAYLIGYCMGKVIERQRQKNPVANYIKEKEMIGIQYPSRDGHIKGTFVPKSFTNKDIKKVISSLEGQEFKGNFKKLSEFEMKKTLKQIEAVNIFN
jgi:hypothetical protein